MDCADNNSGSMEPFESITVVKGRPVDLIDVKCARCGRLVFTVDCFIEGSVAETWGESDYWRHWWIER